jgi:hypothetical protein
MVDYGTAAVFFSVVLLLTHWVIPVSTLVGAVVALRTSGSRLRWRGVANVTAWVCVPWLVCLALLVAVGLDPLRAFAHLEPFNGVVPRLSLGAAALVAVIIAVRVEVSIRQDGRQG